MTRTGDGYTVGIGITLWRALLPHGYHRTLRRCQGLAGKVDTARSHIQMLLPLYLLHSNDASLPVTIALLPQASQE